MKNSIIVRILFSLLLSPLVGFLIAYVLTVNVSNFEGGRGIAHFYLTIYITVISFFVLLFFTGHSGKICFNKLIAATRNISVKIKENPASPFLWWLYPLVFGGILILWFALVISGHYSLSHKLDLFIPYLVFLNVALVFYVYIKARVHLIKFIIASSPSLLLSSLWCGIQITR